MTRRYKQGMYQPTHPEKYIGDIDKIRYMSSYELQMFKFLDNNPNVLEWASEEIKIPYIKPTDGKIHHYWPDLYIKYRTQKGEIKQEIVEIKPAAQTRKPRANTKHALYENLTYAVNLAKWNAAKAWCDHRGFDFRIVTEKSIYK